MISMYNGIRGEGTLHSYTPEGGAKVEGPYKAPAKILLVGHGADEQLGGYGRHITSWTKGGWERLQEELEKVDSPEVFATNGLRIFSGYGNGI